ncbi:glycosyltransferase family 4 protein [Endozoicomonas gorgoniicola]|uniref:Glycosyltransferase family 4 protein n=1 Tax=Endozoicomonas gorgoniicola TaxID=1234144 RepID=A0ABT3MUV6_9GAMM|nr:glycosyltransferase family 4 protein [Endozoicomonas gorgoniicola]MCW7553164.1 glycosyltransferase family 4 protein [Endozoicomonas gorgoniicola]
MKPRSNIVFISASYAPSLLNFRRELIVSFIDNGYKVHAAAPKVDDDIKVKLDALGVVVHEVYMQRTGLNPLIDIMYCWSLVRILRDIRPSIFLAYTIKPVIYGSFAAFIAKIPTRFALITGLGFAFTSKVTGLKRLIVSISRKLYKAALSRSTHVLFQNPDDRQLFTELGLVNIKKCGLINGSGVDLQHYQAAPLPSNSVFLFIGRLLADKGIREFASAARIVKESNPQARFLVAGWIDTNPTAIDQTELEEWINSGTIEFLGKLSDVRPAIRECSVYVLPSYREGTPRTVLEAMAMGRPVITTDAPGCRETVIDGRNGYLVPVKAVDELAEAMTRFIDNPALRATMGQESRLIVNDKYDVHKVNRSIMQQLGIETDVKPVSSYSPQRHRGHREKI